MPCRSGAITVTPGNATVRRNSDLAIRAAVEGFHPQDVQVFVRFADEQEWERAPMQPAERQRLAVRVPALCGARDRCSITSTRKALRSGEHSVTVVDLPRIERVRLTYQYPEWTGIDPKTDDASRDIRAVEGTSVKVEVVADGPLECAGAHRRRPDRRARAAGPHEHRRNRGHEAGPLPDRRARRE